MNATAPTAFRLPTRYGSMGLGGCYAPETLMQPLLELEAAFIEALASPAFMAELLDVL